MSHHTYLTNRQACLIDGDNLARGGQVAVNAVGHVLDRIALFTEGLPVTFAMQSRLAKSYMPAYAGHGWGLRFASMAPDAADQELLEAAAGYIASDVGTLVVVSGDHAFAELAMEKGGGKLPALEALKKSNEDDFKAKTHTIRSDGAWVDLSSGQYFSALSPDKYKYTDSWLPNTYAASVKPGDQIWLNYVNTVIHEALIGIDFPVYQVFFKTHFNVELPSPVAGFPSEYN